ncbi:MAG: response regulator [Candidatus Gastranaerophilaceae bacterium]|jgi:CheY-like chemotaxis protein
MTKTIFIAEDNKINLKLVKDLLELKEYKILEAYDGKEALEKIIQNHNLIDLILMDIQMPVLNGIDAIKELKNNVLTASIPIIVLSAYAMETDIKKAKEAGAEDYITKPLNITEFLTKIQGKI